MNSKWNNIKEAARDFKNILSQKLIELDVDDFRSKLRKSLQENDNFSKEMSRCGALKHWEDPDHLKWLITIETIQESLKAMEIQLGSMEVTQSKDAKKSDAKLKPRVVRRKKEIQITELSSKSSLLADSGYNPTPIPTQRTPRREQKAESSSEEDPSDVLPKIIAGKSLEIILPENYIQIKDVIRQPILDNEELHPIHAVLPFLVQKIKMWGCNIFTAEKLIKIFRKAETKTEEIPKMSLHDLIANMSISSNNDPITTKTENLAPLSRLDIYSCLIAVTEITVLAEMFRILSKFPQPLPLVLHNLDNEGNTSAATHILMFPVLQKCLIRWEVNEGLVENYLFRSPFKLIVALRLGTNATGKSSILNQLFLSSNMFQCRGQPGGNRGTPFSLAGSTEFMWLIEDICKASTWTAISAAQKSSQKDKSEIVLLANLHGDAIEHLNILKSIAPITSKLLVFVMPDAMSDLLTRGNKLTEAFGDEKLTYLFVDPPSSISVPDLSIETAELLNDTTLQKLNKHLKDAVESTESMSLQPKKEETVKIIAPLETPESGKLLDCISRLKSRGDDLRDFLPLQKHFNNPDTQWKAWEANKDLQEMMSLLVAIIKLPLKVRRVAVAHLEKELAILIGVTVAAFSNQLNELAKIRNNYTRHRNYISELSLAEVHEKIRQINVELGKSLSLDDLLRELGFVYEMMTSRSIDSPIYSDLPEYYAELLIEGMTLEILDGELGAISGNWLESVCHSVCKKMPKLNIFVISILGLQSSGKSTLLNSLFGCKFAVSVGKCTRGLFMRLMLLEKSFRKKLKADAILIVDTEGLGAPENMTDKNAEMKDRRMATFAMTISNLTLINVFGEAKNEIAYIMQIVILTMARMDKADLAPDILLIQHVAEGGQEYKIKQGVDEFCFALDEAVQIAKVKGLDLGIKGLENLKQIRNRIEDQELLVQVRPFKSGSSPQSPPTEEYHIDLVKLRHHIFNEIQKKYENRIRFCAWHKVLKSYWNAIQREDFALQFISIRQVQEYIEFNKQLASVKNCLNVAIGYHQEFLRNQIFDKVSAFDSSQDRNASKELEDQIQNEIRESIESSPYNCSIQLNVITNKRLACKYCRTAESSKRDLIEFAKQTSSVNINETEEALEKYTIGLRKSAITQTLRLFESVKIQMGMASEIDKILNDIMVSWEGNSEQQSGSAAVWIELLSRVQKIHPIKNILQQVIDDILEHYPQATNIYNWKMAMDQVPQSENDPKPTLALFNSKAKNSKTTSKYFQVTALVHNSLCENMRGKALDVIYQRQQQNQPYHSIMIENHQKKIQAVLKDAEKEYNYQIKGDLQWDAILYSVQVFAELVIKFQNKWNEEHEPYLILLREKQEYLKKINTYLLAAQSPSVIQQKIASSIAHKLLTSSILLTLSSCDPYKNSDRMFFDPENIRLGYFVTLANMIKSGREDLVLDHFRNPREALEQWYIQEIQDFIQVSQVPYLKQTFFAELSAVTKEIHKTKSSEELKTFIQWYLSKTRETISDKEVISDETFEFMKKALEKEVEKCSNEYCDKIAIENIPLDQESAIVKIGCTATCPRCCAVCWGHKGHDLENLVHLKHHFTCHQPMGLAGVADSSGALAFASCSDLEDSDGVLMPSLNKDSADGQNKPDEASWASGRHPVDDYSRLMQWFFFKLNGSLAEQYGVLPASEQNMRDFGFPTLDVEIDQILNVVRHRSEM